MARKLLARSVAVALAGAGLLPPLLIRAEGAVRVLDCGIAQVCDTSGDCVPQSTRVLFTMEPVAVGPDGAGRYDIRYDGVEAVMEALSDAGPFFWTVGAERHTLLISSATELLWHRLELDPAPAGSVRFLACTLRQ